MDEDLKREILEFLLNDQELFEAIYYYLNDLDYINPNCNGLPLHRSIKHLPKGKFSPEVVVNCLKEMKNSGYVKYESIGENDFDGFCKYIFKITDKGKFFLEEK